MKRYKILSLIIFSLAFVACENTDIQMPAMSYVPNKAIIADTLKCSKGDTITFTPVGNADYVSFWSGEALANYYGVKETTVTNAKINFVSGLYKDAAATSTKYEYKVYLSTDYTANHQLTGTAIISIKAATWRDITPLFADNSTSSATAGKASGDLDVTKYAKKPFYIAFKYKNDTIAKGPTAFVNSFTVADSTKEFGLTTNLISPVTTLVTGVGNTSWYSCLVSGDLIYAKKWVVSGTQVQVTGQATYKNETWLVSPIINLSRGTADMGIAIKDVNGLPRPYLYVYKNAGIYKAVFVYTNSYLGVSKQVKQDFTIQVK
ncbi:MAG: DUF5017 domain-containing protein [Paludibacter sp.]